MYVKCAKFDDELLPSSRGYDDLVDMCLQSTIKKKNAKANYNKSPDDTISPNKVYVIFLCFMFTDKYRERT